MVPAVTRRRYGASVDISEFQRGDWVVLGGPGDLRDQRARVMRVGTAVIQVEVAMTHQSVELSPNWVTRRVSRSTTVLVYRSRFGATKGRWLHSPLGDPMALEPKCSEGTDRRANGHLTTVQAQRCAEHQLGWAKTTWTAERARTGGTEYHRTEKEEL